VILKQSDGKIDQSVWTQCKSGPVGLRAFCGREIGFYSIWGVSYY
jgi:hypothetical protein